MNRIVRIVAVVSFAYQLVIAGAPPMLRMTDQEAIAIATPAIEARFPWAAAKHYRYKALLQINHGVWVWGVYVPLRDQPDLHGGDDPVAEVRDRDGQVLRIYLVRPLLDEATLMDLRKRRFYPGPGKVREETIPIPPAKDKKQPAWS